MLRSTLDTSTLYICIPLFTFDSYVNVIQINLELNIVIILLLLFPSISWGAVIPRQPEMVNKHLAGACKQKGNYVGFLTFSKMLIIVDTNCAQITYEPNLLMI